MHCTCFSVWWKWLKWKHCACCFLMWSNALYVHYVSTIFCALSSLRFTFGQTSIDQENQGSLTESIQYVNLLLQCLMLKLLKAEVKVITIQKKWIFKKLQDPPKHPTVYRKPNFNSFFYSNCRVPLELQPKQ